MRIDYRLFEEIPVASYRRYKILLEGEIGQHRRAHVHIRMEGGTRLASIAIDNGEVLAGEMPRDIRASFSEWLVENRDKLIEDWHAMQKHQRPRTYDFPAKRNGA